ncbi:hypothetical protein [Streptomyces sp. NPDC059631]|uniref:hypothetical protein n=1 Tax=unclassified Streptomyces TaxID=2593676 RepID=UPI0036CE14F2
MRDVLNATSTKNTLGMLRNHDTKTILVLEGDSDSLALRDFIDRSNCRLLVADGKVEAIEAVEWSDIQAHSGVLAIVDSDFVDLAEQRSKSPNVIYTDNYDLDAYIFLSEGAVERCIEHLCSYDRFSQPDNGDSHFQKIKDKATSMARLIACFRLYSIRGNRQISFSRFPFGEVYRGAALELDLGKFRQIAIGKMKSLPDPEAVFDDWWNRAEKEVLPSERIAQGHDLFRCLGLVIESRHGNSHRGEIWEKMARSHFTIDHLRNSEFYAASVAWCDRNRKKVWI